MFKQRTTRPTSENLEYVKTTTGGWSYCILGSPTDKQCNVLHNCVGYASGRFNEIHKEVTGERMKYPKFCCNAEYFIERAKKSYPELTFSDIPAPGSIICWMKGTMSTKDGGGHVEVVERVINNNKIQTTKSGWKSAKPWASLIRTNDNGRWGMGELFTFRKFIVDPAVIKDCIPKADERDEFEPQVEITRDNALRIRCFASTDAYCIGIIPTGIYTYTETLEGEGYTWYKLGDQAWVANTSALTVLPQKEWVAPDSVERDETKNQLYISAKSNLRIRKEPNTTSKIMGMCEKDAYYNVEEVRIESDYTWYKLGECAWAAGVASTEFLPAVKDPKVEELKKEIKELKADIKIKDAEIKSLNTEVAHLNKTVADKDAELEVKNEKIENSSCLATELVEELK